MFSLKCSHVGNICVEVHQKYYAYTYNTTICRITIYAYTYINTTACTHARQAPSIPPVHILLCLRQGVRRSLSFGDTAENEVGGAVKDAADGPELAAHQVPSGHVDDRQPTTHSGAEFDPAAVLARKAV